MTAKKKEKGSEGGVEIESGKKGKRRGQEDAAKKKRKNKKEEGRRA